MSPSALAKVATQVERRDARGALIRLLDELGAVLLQVAPDTYTARPLPDVSGSVGEHVRHILDHVTAFVSAQPSSVLTYDRRDRGTPVETDPAAALRVILRLISALSDAHTNLEMPVVVDSVLTRGAGPLTTWSTLGRELAFVVNHTIHHQALIAVLLSMDGAPLSEAFGYAPTTPRSVRD